MTTRKCNNCGAAMIRILNVDKREYGGGAIMWICSSLRATPVTDAFQHYYHLEIYCEAQPRPKKEVINVEQ